MHRRLWGHEEHAAKLSHMYRHQEERGLQNTQKNNNYSSRWLHSQLGRQPWTRKNLKEGKGNKVNWSKTKEEQTYKGKEESFRRAATEKT